MGSIHDNSCYRREELVVDFVRLAKQGRRTIEPIWLTKPNLPAWAARVRDYLAEPRRGPTRVDGAGG